MGNTVVKSMDMPNRKKILIIIPSIRYGGQEKVAMSTAHLLAKYYDVTLLVFFRSDKEIESTGINIVSCGEETSKRFKFLKRIQTLKKHNKYHASISFSPGANLINICTRDKARTLTSIRGYRSIFSLSGKLKFLLKRTDIMICVSKGIAVKVQEYYGLPTEKVAVLYNPYNFNKIKVMGNETVDDFVFDGLTICNVSHLNEVKGIEHLLRSFLLIHNEIPHTRLLILGDGVMHEALLKLVDLLGLTDYVTFLGYRKNPYKYIAKCDLYIMTSENEGFPNSLVEAMMFVPVVSVNCETGPWEILADECDTIPNGTYEVCKYGVLTPPIQKSRNYLTTSIEGEEKIIAQASVKLLNDKELHSQLKKAAFERVHNFSEERYIENLINLIEQRN